ncbi:hypothetical protein [Micromonospora endolithica]|nr:hypothetical protein [Micromonospora endolithica]
MARRSRRVALLGTLAVLVVSTGRTADGRADSPAVTPTAVTR